MLSAKPSMPTELASSMSAFQLSTVYRNVLPTIMCATTSFPPPDEGDADGEAEETTEDAEVATDDWAAPEDAEAEPEDETAGDAEGVELKGTIDEEEATESVDVLAEDKVPVGRRVLEVDAGAEDVTATRVMVGKEAMDERISSLSARRRSA